MEVYLSQPLKFEPINLVPLGDIQAGVDYCDLDLLEETVERALRADAYFIGMGDYLDCASPSNRAALRSARLYDTIYSTLDEAMESKLDDLLQILKPTKGRWLGMLTGHHVWDFADGTSTDTRLCEALQTTHLGDSAMVKLQFKDGREIHDVTIWAHHGGGSGNTLAAPINKLEKVLEWAEADVYLMGHQHKRVAARIPRFYIEGDTLVAKEKVIACTGSYLKAYLQGSRSGSRAGGSYVEKGMMTPVALGSLMVHIAPTRKLIEGQKLCLTKFEIVN